MPKIIGKSVTVVQDGGLCIDEFAGNVATKDDTLSIARVVVSKPASEPWLTLDYDEWLCVVRGEIELHYGDGEILTVKAGETCMISKGERFRPVFPVGDTEYIPVCLPAFKPERCHREEEGVSETSKKLRDLHSNGAVPPCSSSSVVNDVDRLFHMCQKASWEAAVASGEAYFPPTFEADGGFTHATAVAERLIETANHFYTSSQGDWICLELSKEALKKVGIITRFEEAKPVGGTATGTQWSSWVCPHVFGGIPTQLSGIVTNIYPMKRDSEGTFLSIEGVST
ncbi:mannose-6-phosphate isomerase [Nitzschia inconspicua]|uniref:Mannose-6-phosphate isomerase n=1 Tax=Nitzschia inconspicua TaxID=303405 RepID=A0A9K3LDP7_9STRA|nr:mannose-6-phosphate isomerase [Nitzschia inconspicua]